MYLSKLMLNTKNRGALIDIINPYSLHQTLINMFPDYGYTENSKYLFRLELDERKQTATLLMQSELEPNFDDKIKERYLLIAQSKEFNPVYRAGETLKFRLYANVVSRKTYDPAKDTNQVKKPKDSILVPLYKEDEIESWLNSRAIANGFSICGVPEYAKYYQKSHKKGVRELTHFGVKFDGKLIIENPVLALNAVRNGIGKGKAFGFGLLSLKK